MIVSLITAFDAWTITTGILCNVACGLIGCFLVLRRMSLLGDAISHAILPGLAMAFIITQTRDVGPMLIGAMIVGILTAVSTQMLHRWGRMSSDAAMGVVFTSLFALGVVLINLVASDVDLDPGCVLYGLIETTFLDTREIFGMQIPYAASVLFVILLVNIVAILLFFKELKLVSFDPAMATATGINATVVHLGLMALVACTTVASFEAVGAILVVTMLIAPGATAHLLTDRLSRMLWISAAVGVIAAVVGHFLALVFNTQVSGMMSVVAGLEFALAALFAPRYGVIGRVVRTRRNALRVIREDVLGLLYRWYESGREEAFQRTEIVKALGGGRMVRRAIAGAVSQGTVLAEDGGGLRLSESGLTEAQSVIRSHRLWESYLAKHFDLPTDHLHDPAMNLEHYRSDVIDSELAGEISSDTDPHGEPIPE